jgi:hypothetical protein
MRREQPGPHRRVDAIRGDHQIRLVPAISQVNLCRCGRPARDYTADNGTGAQHAVRRSADQQIDQLGAGR